jgi:beta-glucosidase
VPVTNALRNAPKGQWQTLAIPLGCFGSAGADMQKVSAPFVLSTSGRLTIAISGLAVVSVSVPQDRCSL